jgi:hypothetical protein
MSVNSIGNSLSPQQILQMLQQQSVATADPEAAGADGAGAADPTGQNLPVAPAAAEESATSGGPVTPAKASLDPSTVKALLQLQEQQTQAAEDVFLFGTGGSTGDPLLDALAGNGAGNGPSNGTGVGQNSMPTSLLDALNAAQAKADGTQTDTAAAQTNALNASLANLDPAQLQTMLATMTGSAASGDAIASLTQNIMAMLGSGDTGAGSGKTSSGGVASTTATEE